MNNFEEDLKILTNVSPLACAIKRNCVLKEDYPYAQSGESVNSFHPTGNVGCLLAKDEYMFNIRCYHLIWIEGEIENYPENQKAILLIGNHKGVECCNIILEK